MNIEELRNLLINVMADCLNNDKRVCRTCFLDIYHDEYCGCSGEDAVKAILKIIGMTHHE